MQSRCNGTHVSGGYEIGESVTAGEIFAVTWKETLQFLSTYLSCSVHPPPSRERGLLRVNCQMYQWDLGLRPVQNGSPPNVAITLARALIVEVQVSLDS